MQAWAAVPPFAPAMNTPLVMVLSPFRPPMRDRSQQGLSGGKISRFFLVETGFYADFALWGKCYRGHGQETFCLLAYKITV